MRFKDYRQIDWSTPPDILIFVLAFDIAFIAAAWAAVYFWTAPRWVAIAVTAVNGSSMIYALISARVTARRGKNGGTSPQ